MLGTWSYDTPPFEQLIARPRGQQHNNQILIKNELNASKRTSDTWDCSDTKSITSAYFQFLRIPHLKLSTEVVFRGSSFTSFFLAKRTRGTQFDLKYVFNRNRIYMILKWNLWLIALKSQEFGTFKVCLFFKESISVLKILCSVFLRYVLFFLFSIRIWEVSCFEMLLNADPYRTYSEETYRLIG